MGPTPEAEARLMAYMVGWRKGAGAHALSESEQANPDFMEGWTAGRAAVKAEYGRACERYGTVLGVFRTMGPQL